MREHSASTAFQAARRSILRPLAWVGVFSFAINLLLLTMPLYMMQVYDRVLGSQSIDTLIYLTGVALFALLVLASFDLVRSRVLLAAGEWLEARLAPELFDRLIASALAGTGNRSEAMRDLGTVRNFLSSGGVAVLLDAPWAPAFIAATWLLHPLLGAVALAAAVMLFILAVISDIATRAPLDATNRDMLQAASHTAAVVRDVEAIDAMGMADALLRRWYGLCMRMLSHNRTAAGRAAALGAASKFCRLAVQILLMAAGAWLVTQHVITGGAMIAGSIMMARALAPVEQAIGIARQLAAARLAYKRVRLVLASEGRPRFGLPLPRPEGRLTVESLSWALPNSLRPILRNISFELAPGEALAIVGPSAAGKSSLARLLVGVRRPSAGQVRLDGAEVADWPRAEFGRYVGYLPQDVSLFPGATIAENIGRMGQPDAEAVIEAARKAGVHEMVLRLPKGYDTPLDEIASVLSGGQRQRIALARAIFGKPSLVVLDEPNANLDTEGDAALAAALQELKARGTTVVVVTHRPALVAQVDKVLLLKDGAVEMFGPRKQVLERLRTRPEPVPTTVSVPAPARQMA